MLNGNSVNQDPSSRINKAVLIVIYTHPELYPPTLNAINSLAKEVQNIDVLCQSTRHAKWDYASNVHFHMIQTNSGSINENSRRFGGLVFFRFCSAFLKIILQKRIDLIIFYDPVPLILLSLFFPILKLKNTKFWYHNHDVLENYKHSFLMRLAKKKEGKIFKKLDFFSLPAKERLIHFDFTGFKGRSFIIPNFPSKTIFRINHKEKNESGKVRLLYQGSISPGHGFEEILAAMGSKPDNRKIHLRLIGKCSTGYKQNLIETARINNLSDNFQILDPVPYPDLPEISNDFDIGLAVHLPFNIIYSTGGTASNKIYEYAASGLPVLLYDSSHYRQYLAQYKWCFFTNLTQVSIITEINKIMSDYEFHSNAAILDFKTDLNFESCFVPIMTEIINS
jgi:glycosyltransferase involved in cell wall biosynthesis